MLDLVIRGGDIVDGRGQARYRADVGIRQGRVADIGKIEDDAHDVIDADGLIVAPGFIDVHTHYDAQVFWDPLVTPSSLYGVTTVIGGNCGFGLAPLNTESMDYLMRMLARVEGMSLEALSAGLPWDWETMGDYFERFEPGLAINAGFLVGHSTLRRLVMGDEATQRAAREEELRGMSSLLRACIAAGGLGWSSSHGLAHSDGEGVPVPSRHATTSELLALARVCRDFEGTSIEFMPGDVVDLSDEQVQLMVALSTSAARPLNWNLLRISEASKAAAMRDLHAGTVSAHHGGKVVALTMPIPSRARFSFGTGFVLDALPGWGPTMVLPLEAKREALSDPALRERLKAEATKAPRFLAELVDWGSHVIVEVFEPQLKHYEGRSVSEIAKDTRADAFDALLDICCADNLRTRFSYEPRVLSPRDWEANVDLWRDGRAIIGGSDAGAHLDFTATFDYHTYVIEHAVGKHGVLSLEEAVHLLCYAPAMLYGLRGRGQIVKGGYADMVIFDEDSLRCGELRTRFDLPAGAGRLYSEPTGMQQVIVGGQVVVSDGEATGARAGVVLRSGKDTFTPAVWDASMVRGWPEADAS